MRIQNGINKGLEQVNKERLGKSASSSFSKMMVHSKQKLQQDSLQQLLSKIESQGELLSRQMTVKNVTDYKKMVKQFVSEAVQYGLELQEHQGFRLRGRAKTYHLVKEIDQKLITLTNEVMKQEKNGLEVLSIIGELEGLLVNLYI